MTNPSLMHETWHSKPVHWDNPEGWDGEGGGGRVQDGGHMLTSFHMLICHLISLVRCLFRYFTLTSFGLFVSLLLVFKAFCIFECNQ